MRKNMDVNGCRIDGVVDYPYLNIISKILHKDDYELLRERLEENAGDVLKSMEVYESGLRMYKNAKGDNGQYKELLTACKYILMDIAINSSRLDALKKYLKFCETYKPENPDFKTVLEHFPNNPEPWIQAISYYIANALIEERNELVSKYETEFKTKHELFALKAEILKVNMKLAVKAGTAETSKTLVEQYNILMNDAEILIDFFEELLIYLGECEFPVSPVLCKILDDIVKKYPSSNLAKIVKVCLNVETKLVKNQVISAEDANTSYNELRGIILENPKPFKFRLYFYFIDRIRNKPIAGVHWFHCFLGWEPSRELDHWWIGLLTLKARAPIEVLSNVIFYIHTRAQKKQAMPIITKLLDNMIERRHSDKKFCEYFKNIYNAYFAEDEELENFVFSCWQQIYNYAEEGTMLKQFLDAETEKSGGHLLLFQCYQRNGIKAAREQFERMQRRRIAVEYMLRLELLQPALQFKKIRLLYLDLALRSHKNFDEQTKQALDVLLRWADFEENYGWVDQVIDVAHQILYGDHLYLFWEKWSRTRRYSRPNVSDVF